MPTQDPPRTSYYGVQSTEEHWLVVLGLFVGNILIKG